MPTVRCSRTLPADPEAVWRVVSDVHTQSRWWPRVGRVEGVTPHGFTQVLQTKAGRPVRADFRFVAQDHPYTLVWEQDIAGTPFERVLVAARLSATVEPDGDGARVTLEQRQKMRGLSRLGGVMVRRAMRQILGQALDDLAGIV